jgi:hypothetical protein
MRAVLCWPFQASARKNQESQLCTRQLEELNVKSSDCMVLNLISHVAFMGTNGGGLPTAVLPNGRQMADTTSWDPCRRSTPSWLPQRPTPRYVVGPRCDRPSHVDNFGKEEYEKDILNAMKAH